MKHESGRDVRQCLLEGDGWERLVPHGVGDVLRELHGPAAIIALVLIMHILLYHS